MTAALASKRAPATGWKERLEAAVLRRWYGTGPGVLWLLWPLELLFVCVVWLRRRMYGAGVFSSTRLSVPVIVVGNIVAGGAGKTPLTIALVRALNVAGFRPGVVSRGYGRESTHTAMVGKQSRVDEVGDEPLLIAREAEVPVAVSARRAEAAKLLVEQGCRVIVADDGLQHYALGRDVEIGVIPGERLHGNGHLLPLGPLREPRSRLERCDYRVVMNPSALRFEDTQVFTAQGCVGDLIRVCDGRREPLTSLENQEVLAVAAIAHPNGFFNALRAAGLRVIERRFSDHHALNSEDIARPDGMPVVMTSKDAVKCSFVQEADVYALEYTVEPPMPLLHSLQARLRALGVKTSKATQTPL